MQLGDRIFLQVQTYDASGPADPDAAPVAEIYSSTGTLVKTVSLPPIRDYMFGLTLFLGSDFAVGRYGVRYTWSVSTFDGAEQDSFRVLEGGDAVGQYTAMTFVSGPEADFVIGQTDGGTVGSMRRNRSPRL